jgi:mono/diheme cytochrome c family protein
MKKLRVLLIAAAVLALAGWAALSYWRTKNISRVQRGWHVAERKGCFTCHGPGGLRGMANPGYGFDEVPPFTRELITMYVESENEIREWILDGIPKRIAQDPEQRKHRERAVVPMPAWRGLLSQGELEDLVAFVKAASDFERPQDENAEEGRKVAERFGCFNCHGPQGRGSPPNLRAFKGYIPSWDGADFPELARDDAEVREWILDGRPKRLHENSIARWFLSRQPIKMPAYRGHISEAEVDRIVDYIHWVRQHPY